MTPEDLIALGVVLSTVGGAMVWTSGAPDRGRLGRSAGPPAGTHRSVALACATVVGAIIAGPQWILLSATGPTTAAGPVWVTVLAPPAFLAGATLVRVALAISAAIVRRRRRDRRTGVEGGQR